MSTVTRTISDWASKVRYEDLTPEVVREAKRFLMDSMGCALGGAQQHDVHIARKVLGEMAGIGELPRPGHRRAVGPGLRLPPQRPDDPGDGLQRHLLATGPMPPLRHHSGGDGLRRARRWFGQGPPGRHRPRLRVRAAPLRGLVPRRPRDRLAPRHPHRRCVADRRRPHARSRRRADAARHRDLGLAPLHAGLGDRRQADHDEEHRRPHGHPVRRAGGAAGRTGLHRPRARARRAKRASATFSTPSGSSTFSPTASGTPGAS